MAESKRSRSGYGTTTDSQELRSLVSNHQNESLSDSDEDYSPTTKLNDTSTTWITRGLISILKALDTIGPQRLPEIEKDSNHSAAPSIDHYDKPNLYGHGYKKSGPAPSSSIAEEKEDINIIPKSTLVKLVTGNSNSTLRELFTEETSHEKEGRQRSFYRGRI